MTTMYEDQEPYVAERVAHQLALTQSELDRTNLQLAHALGRIRQLEAIVTVGEQKEREYLVAMSRRLAAVQDAVGRSVDWRAA